MSTTPVRTSRAGLHYADNEPSRTPRECLACGTTFLPSIRRRDQRFCCKPCRNRYNNAQRMRAEKQREAPRTCPICGRMFTAGRNAKTYDRAECRKEAERIRKAKPDAPPRKPPQPHQGFRLARTPRKPSAESAVAVLPGEEHRHIRGTFTNAGLASAYAAIRAELALPVAEPLTVRTVAEYMREAE